MEQTGLAGRRLQVGSSLAARRGLALKKVLGSSWGWAGWRGKRPPGPQLPTLCMLVAPTEGYPDRTADYGLHSGNPTNTGCLDGPRAGAGQGSSQQRLQRWASIVPPRLKPSPPGLLGLQASKSCKACKACLQRVLGGMGDGGSRWWPCSSTDRPLSTAPVRRARHVLCRAMYLAGQNCAHSPPRPTRRDTCWETMGT